jgi:ribonuclease HII
MSPHSRIRDGGTQDSMLQFELAARASGFVRVAGVDEAGRGPLAGPVVAAAVVLREPVPGLNDSKLLTECQRESFFEVLMNGGHEVGRAMLSSTDIDALGIQQANYAAMLQAVNAIELKPDFLLVDGFRLPGCAIPHQAIIKGDRLSQSIAAASIVAKVTRDRHMLEMDATFPGYGFGRHKGYATRAHLEALERLGPCAIHRRSFAPVACAPKTGALSGVVPT